MKYYKILIMSCICILLMGGCVLKRDFSNTEQTPIIISSPSPIVKNKPQNPIVEDDPLLNLTPEEFEIEYNKLPDDYRIKVNKNIVKKYFNYSIWAKAIVDKNGTITKKQAEKVYSFDKDEEENKHDSLSLQGLRYFRNIEEIVLTSYNLADISELSYCNKLDYLYFDSCKFEKKEIGIGIRRFLTSKTLGSIAIQNCGLSNLDFLSGLSDLNGAVLDFSQNNISDLTPLSNLKHISGLDLSDNKITDLTPIARLEVHSISLSGNPITDISPLKTLDLINGEDGITNATIELADLDIDYDMAKELFGYYLETERQQEP